VLPRVAAADGLLPCSLEAGWAGFYAGARHGVARGAARVLPRVAAAEPSPCSLLLLRWRARVGIIFYSRSTVALK
jgi:hypothetical protein